MPPPTRPACSVRAWMKAEGDRVLDFEPRRHDDTQDFQLLDRPLTLNSKCVDHKRATMCSDQWAGPVDAAMLFV